MKSDRAHKIAATLNDTNEWHSHGYGISIEVLERDLKLQIDDFGANMRQSEAIHKYHNLLSDHMQNLGVSGVVHIANRFKPYM